MSTPTHGAVRNHHLETVTDTAPAAVDATGAPVSVPGSSLSVSVCDRYCDRCGWITIRGVMEALKWGYEHEEPHAP